MPEENQPSEPKATEPMPAEPKPEPAPETPVAPYKKPTDSIELNDDVRVTPPNSRQPISARS